MALPTDSNDSWAGNGTAKKWEECFHYYGRKYNYCVANGKISIPAGRPFNPVIMELDKVAKKAKLEEKQPVNYMKEHYLRKVLPPHRDPSPKEEEAMAMGEDDWGLPWPQDPPTPLNDSRYVVGAYTPSPPLLSPPVSAVLLGSIFDSKSGKSAANTPKTQASIDRFEQQLLTQPKKLAESMETFLQDAQDENVYQCMEAAVKELDTKKPFAIKASAKPKSSNHKSKSKKTNGKTKKKTTYPKFKRAGLHCKHCLEDPCIIRQFYDKFDDHYDKFDDHYDSFDDTGMDNNEKHHSAYRFMTRMMWGVLSTGSRKKLPQCVVSEIRDSFPSPDGLYKGRRPSGGNVPECKVRADGSVVLKI